MTDTTEPKPGFFKKAKKATASAAAAVGKKAGNFFGKVKSVFKGKKETPPTPPTSSSYKP